MSLAASSHRAFSSPAHFFPHLQDPETVRRWKYTYMRQVKYKHSTLNKKGNYCHMYSGCNWKKHSIQNQTSNKSQIAVLTSKVACIQWIYIYYLCCQTVNNTLQFALIMYLAEYVFNISIITVLKKTSTFCIILLLSILINGLVLSIVY